MATKTYYIGPQDGWFNIASVTTKASIRISAFPHTHPFFVFADTTATPSLTADAGVMVCHHPFEVQNFQTAGNVEKFYIRVQTPYAGSKNNDGKLRIDVHCDGAALL